MVIYDGNFLKVLESYKNFSNYFYKDETILTNKFIKKVENLNTINSIICKRGEGISTQFILYALYNMINKPNIKIEYIGLNNFITSKAKADFLNFYELLSNKFIVLQNFIKLNYATGISFKNGSYIDFSNSNIIKNLYIGISPDIVLVDYSNLIKEDIFLDFYNRMIPIISSNKGKIIFTLKVFKL